MYFTFYLLSYVQAAVAIESVSFECPKGEYMDVNIVKRTYYLVTIVKNNHHQIIIPGSSCNIMLKFIVYNDAMGTMMSDCDPENDRTPLVAVAMM